MRGPGTKALFLGALLAGTAPSLAARAADDFTDALTLAPYQTEIGNAELSLGGAASGAGFTRDQPGVPAQGVSGALKAMPSLHRDYDSGLSLGVNATLALDDALSRGRYDGDFLEKLYGEARTGLGRAQIGQTDGAGYALAVGGPKVDAQVSLDDPQTTFFRDPASKRAFTDVFTLRTEIGASANAAKFAYISPALFGLQLALSFAPGEGKDVLPFLHAGPQVAGRQADIWEAALRYSDQFGPVSLSAYGGAAVGRAEHKMPGQEGVSDLGAGLRADYPVSDALALSWGASWRQSNAYAFAINRSFQSATTRAFDTSVSATHDQWIAGLEYGDGAAGAPAMNTLPRLSLKGYEASLGYVLSDNVQITGGWQRLDYARASGIFYNGAGRIGMDAGFLHLNIHV